ncbi:MAG: SPOR domain-containing protein [Aquimonas sp.]|nr:SPOR domain-containing protein [Aquimonas sp.]
MDAALKQRLIGATVLVALAVIFLPMLVSGPEAEREAATEQLSLDLPGRPDRALETRELPVLPTPAPLPAPGEGPEVLATVDTAAEQRFDALSGEPVGTTVADAAPAPAVSPAPGAPAAAAPSVPAAASPPVAAAPAPVPAAAPAPSRPVEPAAPLPAATAGGQFAVNVGSYANAANAENLLRRLRAASIAAYSEPATHQGRAVQRVRLGPFAQRTEAERARQAALAIQRDLPTSIISLDAAPAATPAARPSAAANAGFAVQIGALRSERDALALRDRARGAGFVAFVEQVNSDSGLLWRVRVGPELDRSSAERRRGELRSALGVEGLVVSHP